MLTARPAAQNILPAHTTLFGSRVLGTPPSVFEGESSLAVPLPHVAAGLSRRLRLALC
jgi:hypothetical protein